MVDPLVSQAVFDRIQQRWRSLPQRYSREDLLAHLRLVWREHGKITTRLIKSTPGPCTTLYHIRFGGLGAVYREVGYVERPQRYERKRLLRDAQLLEGLKRILARESYISSALITREPGLARPITFIRR